MEKFFSNPTNVRDVEHGRTRGVETWSVEGEDLQGRAVHYLVHDYGGQEEFLLQHADRLCTANSVYVVVVPMVAVGKTKKEVRLRSDEEIRERYLFWLRFIYSLVLKQSASAVQSIPLLTVLNSFTTESVVHQQKHRVAEVASKLSSVLQDYFSVHVMPSSSDVPATTRAVDFLVASLEPVQANCVHKHAVDRWVEPLQRLVTVCQAQPVSTAPVIVSFVLDRLSARDTRPLLFLSEDRWLSWLAEQVNAYRAVVDHKTGSTEDHVQLVQRILVQFCHRTLQSLQRIAHLALPMGASSSSASADAAAVEMIQQQVVTDPSLLTSAVMGDLFYWFVKQRERREKDHVTPEELKLTQEEILSHLQAVSTWFPREMAGKIETAWDLLQRQGEARHFPIVALLHKMKLTIVLLNERGQQVSWLLGLAPEKPADRVLSLDVQPSSQVIRRFFRLPDRRYVFFPGYFLRLFVFLHDLEPWLQIEAWQSAVYMHGRSARPDEPGLMLYKQIVVEQREHEGLAGFMVSVQVRPDPGGTEAALSGAVAYKYMSQIRRFILRNMWGLEPREFCVLPTEGTIVEDLDTVEQQVVGIVPADQHQLGGRVDAMTLRRNMLERYFGSVNAARVQVEQQCRLSLTLTKPCTNTSSSAVLSAAQQAGQSAGDSGGGSAVGACFLLLIRQRGRQSVSTRVADCSAPLVPAPRASIIILIVGDRQGAG